MKKELPFDALGVIFVHKQALASLLREGVGAAVCVCADLSGLDAAVPALEQQICCCNHVHPTLREPSIDYCNLYVPVDLLLEVAGE